MKTSSAKAKGRNLQKHVRDKILSLFTSLEQADVKSTSMGASGEDVQLSPFARKLLPISVECKAKKAIAIYKDYEQCKANASHYEPMLVIKQNASEVLAIVRLDYILELQRINMEYYRSNR